MIVMRVPVWEHHSPSRKNGGLTLLRACGHAPAQWPSLECGGNDAALAFVARRTSQSGVALRSATALPKQRISTFTAYHLFLLCTCLYSLSAHAAPGDWPQPRQNPHLTGIQPLPGTMTNTPLPQAVLDLGRSQAALSKFTNAADTTELAVSIVGGELFCHYPSGALRWQTHPAGLNFTGITASEDLDGDGTTELLLQAERPGKDYAAAVLISADDGRLLWRYDVEPMSYAWYLFAGNYVDGAKGKQIIVLMQAYPPDPKNGYIALFSFGNSGEPPAQRWRFDFDAYTCFPSLLQTDLEADGKMEIVVECHSKMWIFDADTGAVKQFYTWDVSPANIRSYGLVKFVDLNRDGLEDFLCIANFAQHHEVLLNKQGKFEKAWGYGWDESVTTGKVVTTWADPPDVDVDSDGTLEIVLSMYNSENENAWLTRIYDAVTGTVKYRIPGVIAVSCDPLGDSGPMGVLCNLSTDPTRTRLDGACLYVFKDGNPVELWRDPAATAVEAKNQKRVPVQPPQVDKDGARLALTLNPDGRIVPEPFALPPKPAKHTDFNAVPALAGPPAPPLFAADFDNDGVNELALFQDPKLRVFKLEDSAFVPFREYISSCAPVLADLNGDGRIEVITLTVAPDALPLVRAVTPADNDAVIWEARFPEPGRTGLPAPRKAYMRPVHCLGRDTPDLYVWAGTPLVRSAALDGRTGTLLWEKGELPGLERYCGASVNLASATDFNADGKEDLVFTCPDYYCVADGPTGELLLGPSFPPKIFGQPSQGLYTFPAVLDRSDNIPLVSLVDGHYFQAAMTIKAEPLWYKIPPPGDNRCACEGFLQLADGTWLTGFGRQNGNFACVNAADGTVRWELPLDAAASDTITCDINGDGMQEFLFGTSHGDFYAIADDGDKPNVLWKADIGAACGAPIAADLNNDGASEIAVPTVDGRITLLASTPRPKGPVAKVEQVNGAPSFTFDGQPHNGLSYMSYTGSAAMGPDAKPLLAQYVKSLAGADCDLFTFVTDLGCLYGYSTTVWPEKDKWDFSQTDANAHMILQNAGPNAKLVIQLYIDAPKWWAEAHPDDLLALSNGTKDFGEKLFALPRQDLLPSMASPAWRNDMKMVVEKFIDHVQQSDYADRIVGYQVCGQKTEEWYHWSMNCDELGDYSPAMTAAWRAWLRDKYKTDGALRAAWGATDAAIASAVIPDKAARYGDRAATFRDPVREMPVIDFHRFWSDVMVDTIAYFAKVVKDKTRHTKVVGAFYAYTFEFAELAEDAGHLSLERLLHCPDLDFIMSPSSYHERKLGGGQSLFRMPVLSVNRHGKMLWNDFDAASFKFYEKDQKQFAPWLWQMAVTDTPEKFVYMMRRELGNALENGVNMAYFDLHGGYYEDPVILEGVRKSRELRNTALSRDRSSSAQVLVVVDEDSMHFMGFRNPILRNFLIAQLAELPFVAPFDSVLLSDLADLPMDRYRMVVFLNTFRLDDAQRKTIADRLQNNGRSVVWLYAPGCFRGDHVAANADGVSEMTGMRVVPAERPSTPAAAVFDIKALAQAEPVVPDRPLLDGDQFIVDDPEAVALAKRSDTGKPVVAMKNLAEWTSFYAATAPLPRTFLRAVAAHAGVHLHHGNPQDAVYANRSWLTLVPGPQEGPRALTLPFKAGVRDAFTGETLCENADRFTTNFKPSESRIFSVEQNVSGEAK